MQLEQLNRLAELYVEYNQQVNLISRQDLANLEERHLLHSLAVYSLESFAPNSYVLDLGTGGGLPGLPLAIVYPNVKFHLIDATRKKIRIVQELIAHLGLKNVQADHLRVEEISSPGVYDYVVSRAVANLQTLWNYANPILKQNGLMLCLKGGDLSQEIKSLPEKIIVESLSINNIFSETYFQEKYLLKISR